MDWIDHKCIKECLQKLSDKSYQERVWARDARPEMSSFEEAVCQLYGGTGLDVAYNKGHQIYGEQIDGLLKDLGAAVQGIPINRPPIELVQDEKMVRIRQMAAHILNLIEQQDKEKRPA